MPDPFCNISSSGANGCTTQHSTASATAVISLPTFQLLVMKLQPVCGVLHAWNVNSWRELLCCVMWYCFRMKCWHARSTNLCQFTFKTVHETMDTCWRFSCVELLFFLLVCHAFAHLIWSLFLWRLSWLELCRFGAHDDCACEVCVSLYAKLWPRCYNSTPTVLG